MDEYKNDYEGVECLLKLCAIRLRQIQEEEELVKKSTVPLVIDLTKESPPQLFSTVIDLDLITELF